MEPSLTRRLEKGSVMSRLSSQECSRIPSETHTGFHLFITALEVENPRSSRGNCVALGQRTKAAKTKGVRRSPGHCWESGIEEGHGGGINKSHH
jgi:hypothetical protein